MKVCVLWDTLSRSFEVRMFHFDFQHTMFVLFKYIRNALKIVSASKQKLCQNVSLFLEGLHFISETDLDISMSVWYSMAVNGNISLDIYSSLLPHFIVTFHNSSNCPVTFWHVCLSCVKQMIIALFLEIFLIFCLHSRFLWYITLSLAWLLVHRVE